ncbi:acyltransferase [Gammaproteobacteria bacterium 45_16_T64]|nr:acyltransferase [Gammaproteobacteria bacterium 45_16_T64]
MLSFLPGPIKAVLTFGLILLNTVLLCVPLFSLSLFKVLVPIKFVQRLLAKCLVLIAESWVGINGLILGLMQRLNIDIKLPESLGNSGWYLVTCNHQSWVDILILQKIFWKEIPFLKFFLKQELIWVPFLGVAWWALDFPFMKRFSREYLEKHPEMKGKDLETTKQACRKFRELPVSVMNFVEGTRFDETKRVKHKSNYANLLNPKSGGVAFVLSAMGGQLQSMVDVTIVYHDKNFEFWDLMFGRVSDISVRIVERPIPENMALGDYEGDPEFREQLQGWLGGIWQEKDDLITQIKSEGN